MAITCIVATVTPTTIYDRFAKYFDLPINLLIHYYRDISLCIKEKIVAHNYKILCEIMLYNVAVGGIV